LWIITSGEFNHEYHVIDIVQEYLDFYRKLDMDLPIFVFLSFIGVKGYKVASYTSHNNPVPIERDIFTLPEVTINSLDEAIPALMKPLFDIVWNASGLERSDNYDNLGNWKGKT
jgi:hypothetical protein